MRDVGITDGVGREGGREGGRVEGRWERGRGKEWKGKAKEGVRERKRKRDNNA